MPKLQVSLPDGTEVSHELGEDTITVGRLEDNLLTIDDASVSSHHAELTLSGTDYVLRDLGSTNGTRINGQPINPEEEHRLQDGDTIRLGHIETIYVSENPAAARPMPAEEEPVAVAAQSSAKPSNFSNASPFQTKKKKKDPAGAAVMALAGLAILAFVGAVATVFMLQPPS
jgi:pSer/pThr/pTyr-binding forkhead associated (FHA) protein